MRTAEEQKGKQRENAEEVSSCARKVLSRSQTFELRRSEEF